MSVLRPFICKAMTEEAWSSLRQAKIVTVTDFLARDNEEIARTCSIDYKDVMSIGRVLLARYSAFPVLASQLYSAAVTTQAIFSTGFTSLDDLLEGGFYAGELCELTGETAAGKTQVCLRTALMVAWAHSQPVVVVDTCGSWSSQAAAAFCTQYLQADSEARCGEMEAALSRIRCVQAVDVYSLLSILEDLSSALTTQVEGPYSGARLVIVDSVTALFTPIQGGQQMDSLALLEQLGLKLKSLATEHSVAVLVTNSVRSEGGHVIPCLGKVWAHTPHTRLLLRSPNLPPSTTTAPSSACPLRRASIISSVRMATGTSEAQIDLSSPMTPCLPN